MQSMSWNSYNTKMNPARNKLKCVVDKMWDDSFGLKGTSEELALHKMSMIFKTG